MSRQGLAASVAFRIDAVLLAIGIVAFADGLSISVVLHSAKIQEMEMTVYLSHRAIAATVKKDDAPYNGAGVSCVDEPIMTTKDVVRAELPPVFFKNDFGVVTNRRQFKEFYSYELASGRPIGPHVFARR
jgi:hypothetical protein